MVGTHVEYVKIQAEGRYYGSTCNTCFQGCQVMNLRMSEISDFNLQYTLQLSSDSTL